MGKWRCLEIEAYAAACSRQKRNGNRTSRLLHSPSQVSVSARILWYDMDTDKAAACASGGKDDEARPVSMSRFISNISGFFSSYTAMELK